MSIVNTYRARPVMYQRRRPGPENDKVQFQPRRPRNKNCDCWDDHSYPNRVVLHIVGERQDLLAGREVQRELNIELREENQSLREELDVAAQNLERLEKLQKDNERLARAIRDVQTREEFTFLAYRTQARANRQLIDQLNLCREENVEMRMVLGLPPVVEFLPTGPPRDDESNVTDDGEDAD